MALRNMLGKLPGSLLPHQTPSPSTSSSPDQTRPVFSSPPRLVISNCPNGGITSTYLQITRHLLRWQILHHPPEEIHARQRRPPNPHSTSRRARGLNRLPADHQAIVIYFPSAPPMKLTHLQRANPRLYATFQNRNLTLLGLLWSNRFRYLLFLALCAFWAIAAICFVGIYGGFSQRVSSPEL